MIGAIIIFLPVIYFLASSKKLHFEREIVSEFQVDEGTVDEKQDKKDSIKNENHPNSILSLINKNFEGSDFKAGNVLVSGNLYTRYFISYKSDGLSISGIMSVPEGEGPFPVLILNHGYIAPEIYTNGRGLRREQDYFAKNGYAVIHPDYRGYALSDPDPETGDEQGLAYSGYVSDAVNLVLALQESGLDHLNLGKIGMLGHSMGGGVTMNALISRPDLFDAAVLLAPVSSDYQKNFLRWRKDSLDDEELEILEREIGDTDDENNFSAFSSAFYFDRINAPIMIHQGTADKDVPVEWSRETRDRLEESGKEVIYFEYPGEPHEFASAWPTVMERTLYFFDKNLK